MTIFVDADACPVKDEIVTLANTYLVDVIFVASYDHVTSYDYGGKWVYVDTGKEAADLYIMNHAVKQDIVVTQDIGLASVLLKKNIFVINPRGKIYLEKDMDTILDLRYLSAKERRKGTYTKGPKAFSDEDRIHFITTLKKNLSKRAGFNAET
ncbi:YaiI/YqxD family protein [Bacillus timonensis]|nr:YaiI/YqxD family protein [Bacillus timonensis]